MRDLFGKIQAATEEQRFGFLASIDVDGAFGRAPHSYIVATQLRTGLERPLV